MDEKTQQEFLGWLSDQYEIGSHDALERLLEKLGPKGIKEHFEEFKFQKDNKSAKVKDPTKMKDGGKAEYIKSLKKHKVEKKKECTICEKIKKMKK